MQVTAQAQVGQLQVRVTSHRGHSVDELADAAVARILYVGDTVHPAIRDQAVAFKEHIRQIISFYMNQAVKSDRTTVANILKNAGHSELAALIEV